MYSFGFGLSLKFSFVLSDRLNVCRLTLINITELEGWSYQVYLFDEFEIGSFIKEATQRRQWDVFGRGVRRIPLGNG